MTNKTKIFAIESLLNNSGINKKENLEFFEVLRKFTLRNSLGIDKKKKQMIYCPKCLKAFIVKNFKKTFAGTAENEELFQKALDIINCEIGHEGYYTDNGKLIKLE
jgi:hypothetical protein